MKGNQISLAQAIDSFIKEARLQTGMDEARIKILWEELMGKPIARHTADMKLREEKLYLTIDSAPLKNELFYSRDKIKELLNRELGHEAIKHVLIF
ncbi:MAG: DUF721 domain-containing protein [Chitinophagales bacterium]